MPDLNEGTKNDSGKVSLDLWSPDALEETAKVLAFGAEKYESYNWAKGIKFSRVFSALLRHLWAYWRGERNDQETGLTHLGHAMCCLMFLLHYELNEQYRRYDDRPNYSDTTSSGDTKEELSRTCGQRGEDSFATVSPLPGCSPLPGSRAHRITVAGTDVLDPRD